jgi:hypothetical protein
MGSLPLTGILGERIFLARKFPEAPFRSPWIIAQFRQSLVKPCENVMLTAIALVLVKFCYRNWPFAVWMQRSIREWDHRPAVGVDGSKSATVTSETLRILDTTSTKATTLEQLEHSHNVTSIADELWRMYWADLRSRWTGRQLVDMKRVLVRCWRLTESRMVSSIGQFVPSDDVRGVL